METRSATDVRTASADERNSLPECGTPLPARLDRPPAEPVKVVATGRRRAARVLAVSAIGQDEFASINGSVSAAEADIQHRMQFYGVWCDTALAVVEIEKTDAGYRHWDMCPAKRRRLTWR